MEDSNLIDIPLIAVQSLYEYVEKKGTRDKYKVSNAIKGSMKC